MSQETSLRNNLGLAGAGLCAGIAVGFGGLWLAADAEAVTTADRALLIFFAAGCLVAGLLPGRRKRPTPGGLAK